MILIAKAQSHSSEFLQLTQLLEFKKEYHVSRELNNESRLMKFPVRPKHHVVLCFHRYSSFQDFRHQQLRNEYCYEDVDTYTKLKQLHRHKLRAQHANRS
jgi:hypothetical protein